jgi:hypothetical protein
MADSPTGARNRVCSLRSLRDCRTDTRSFVAALLRIINDARHQLVAVPLFADEPVLFAGVGGTMFSWTRF